MKTKNVIKFFTTVLMAALLAAPNLSHAQDEEEDEGFTFGGAIRYNIASENYESEPTTTNTYATWDTWRLNVDGSMGGINLSFEYRFYPTFNTHFIHHGYFGYDFSDNLNMQLGVTQVPFGNLTFNSHSWWFLTPYYVGLEDDYDMGVKFDYDISENLNLKAAYFRQAEPAGPSYGSASFGGPAAGTYSYNVINDDGSIRPSGTPASLRELNQFNARLGYMLFEGTEIGVSGQIQGLHNSELDDTEYGHAMSIHANSNFGDFNFKFQYTNYDYAAKDNEGNTVDVVQMGAYGDQYYGDGVAARADMISLGLAYGIDVDMGPISNIQPYIDYTIMTKDGSMEVEGEEYDFADSHMLVPGFLITSGNIFTYVDFAMGKNHAWLTDSFGTGFGAGHTDGNGVPNTTDDMDWNLRFNINMGYYF